MSIRAWARGRRRELLLGGSSLLAVAVLGDVALTVTGAVPTIETLSSRFALHYRPAVLTLGRLEPSQTLSIEGRPTLEINARGFRGPEIETPKPAGRTRIAFLGGSQVFDPEGPNWPVGVGRQLMGGTTSRGLDVDVINAGVPSHRTTDSLGKCIAELWVLEPDVIVLCQAWNDLKYLSRLTVDTPYGDLYVPRRGDWRLDPTGFDRLLCASSFYRLARVRFMKSRFGSEGERRRQPVSGAFTDWGLRQYRLNLELVCDFAENIGARVVLCKQARLPVEDSSADDRARIGYDHVGLDHERLLDGFERCDRALEDVAREKGAALIDMHDAMSGRSDWFSDHIHFTAEGSREAARFVAASLADVLGADDMGRGSINEHEATGF